MNNVLKRLKQFSDDSHKKFMTVILEENFQSIHACIIHKTWLQIYVSTSIVPDIHIFKLVMLRDVSLHAI